MCDLSIEAVNSFEVVKNPCNKCWFKYFAFIPLAVLYLFLLLLERHSVYLQLRSMSIIFLMNKSNGLVIALLLASLLVVMVSVPWTACFACKLQQLLMLALLSRIPLELSNINIEIYGFIIVNIIVIHSWSNDSHRRYTKLSTASSDLYQIPPEIQG